MPVTPSKHPCFEGTHASSDNSLGRILEAGSASAAWRLLVACLLLCPFLRAEEAPAKDDFAPLVKLAPFVVKGQSLQISIYARTKSDRRYGEEFSERVIKVVHEAVTESTGANLRGSGRVLWN